MQFVENGNKIVLNILNIGGGTYCLNRRGFFISKTKSKEREYKEILLPKKGSKISVFFIES